MTNPEALPRLSQLAFPAYLSLRKGVKIGNEDIYLERNFSGVLLEQSRQRQFRALFGFKTDVPLAYLYPLAQRAHLALMLDKRFTIGVPGMVHLSNLLEQFAPVDPKTPFLLHATVRVPAREAGSLLPVLTLDYYQKGRRVAYCESHYLAKRKRKPKGPKKERERLGLDRVLLREDWEYSPRGAKEYARISGDKNPIHLNGLFARMVGFKKRIMHGWYSASKAAAAAEELRDLPVRRLEVNFQKPVLLPSLAAFSLGPEGTGLAFTLDAGDTRLMEGKALFD